jgi:beta-carotene 15,15'-dioxygenase
MGFRDQPVHAVALAITAVFLVLSLLRIEQMETMQYGLLAAGTLFIGLPHGATDNYLFSRFTRRSATASFYAAYLLVAILYGVLWRTVPAVSLVFFLGISVYHFGQSNLFYLDLPEGSVYKKFIYLGWGAFYLASPILFRYQEAQPIIEQLIGPTPLTVETAHRLAPGVSGGLVAANIAVLFILFRLNRISGPNLVKEIAALGLLLALFATAPLFVSFIVYWAFWHSLNSAIEISHTWHSAGARKRLVQFYRLALPLTVITLAGMALIFLVADVYRSMESLIALFFVIIATVTLPHSVIMELLYRGSTSAPQHQAH